jgi:hypothetical protein
MDNPDKELLDIIDNFSHFLQEKKYTQLITIRSNEINWEAKLLAWFIQFLATENPDIISDYDVEYTFKNPNAKRSPIPVDMVLRFLDNEAALLELKAVSIGRGRAFTKNSWTILEILNNTPDPIKDFFKLTLDFEDYDQKGAFPVSPPVFFRYLLFAIISDQEPEKLSREVDEFNNFDYKNKKSMSFPSYLKNKYEKTTTFGDTGYKALILNKISLPDAIHLEQNGTPILLHLALFRIEKSD